MPALRRLSSPALALLALAPLAACGDRKEDSAAEGTIPDPTGAACSEDSQCGEGTICEAAECTPGDRSNSPEEAVSVFYEEDNPGLIYPAGDEDWFSFQGNAGSFLRISTVSDDASELDTVVSLYDAQGARVAWEDGYAGGTVSSYDSMVFAYLSTTGTYYVKVEDIGTFYPDGTPYGADDAAYTLSVQSYGDGGDEPDSLQDAGLSADITGPNLFSPLPVAFSDADDRDHCAISLPATDAPLYLYTMQNDDGSAATPLLRLYDSAGNLVLQAEDPPRDAGIQLLANQDDRYVLEVSDASGSAGPDHWAWVFVIAGDPGDGNPREQEPNDATDSATPLDLGDQQPDSGTYLAGYAQGALDTPGDLDTFALDLPEELYITVALGAQSYGGLLQPRLQILDASGTAVETIDSTPGTDEGALNLGPFPAGTWYLQISGAPDAPVTGGEGFSYRFGAHLSSFMFE